MQSFDHLTQSRRGAEAQRVKRIFAAIAVSLCLCVSALIAFGQERDVAAEFKAVKGPLTAQLRGKRANRLEAVKKLEAYPTPDAAKLLLHQGMGSNDEEVARASFDALVKFSSDKEVCA